MNMRVCKKCSEKFDDDISFCPQCGNKFENINSINDNNSKNTNNSTIQSNKKICQKCGKQLNNNDTFCPGCGTQQKKKKGANKAIVIFLIIVFGIWLFSDTDTENKENADKNNDTTSVKEKLSDIEQIRKDYNIDTFKSTCEKISYEDLSRNPDNYKEKHICFTGKIVQIVSEKEKKSVFRIDVTKDEYGFYKDTIYAEITNYNMNSRILDDDIIEVCGISKGLYEYTGVLGTHVAIPHVDVAFYERKS